MKTLVIEPVSGGSAGSHVAYRRRCQIPLPSRHRPLWLMQTAKRDTLMMVCFSWQYIHLRRTLPLIAREQLFPVLSSVLLRYPTTRFGYLPDYDSSSGRLIEAKLRSTHHRHMLLYNPDLHRVSGPTRCSLEALGSKPFAIPWAWYTSLISSARVST